MQIDPYLSFNGRCAEAFRFYEQCFDGKIVAMVTHADIPGTEEVPEEWKDRILHARLVVGDAVLMGSDSPPAHFEEARGISVSLRVDTPEMAERIFRGLSEGGTVQMPIAETFWAVRFGMVVDRFGIPWMVNCEKAS